MTITLSRPTALIAAIAASALSLTLALTPMAAHAASPVDAAIAACGTAWANQTAGVQDVRMDRLNDTGAKLKLTLRGRDAAGARISTRCVVSAKGEVLSLGDTPVTQIAAK